MKIVDGKQTLDELIEWYRQNPDGRIPNARLVKFERMAEAVPDAADILRRILGMHESRNCGAYNGEAVLSESMAGEVRRWLEQAGVKPDDWSHVKPEKPGAAHAEDRLSLARKVVEEYGGIGEDDPVDGATAVDFIMQTLLPLARKALGRSV